MRIGRLKHKLTIQHQSGTTTDQYGAEHPVYSTFETVRAEKRPLFGRDLMLAQSMQSEAKAKFLIRYLSGLNSTMRIVEGSTTYEIIGEPVDINGKGRFQEILCKSLGGA